MMVSRSSSGVAFPSGGLALLLLSYHQNQKSIKRRPLSGWKNTSLRINKNETDWFYDRECAAADDYVFSADHAHEPASDLLSVYRYPLGWESDRGECSGCGSDFQHRALLCSCLDSGREQCHAYNSVSAKRHG